MPLPKEYAANLDYLATQLQSVAARFTKYGPPGKIVVDVFAAIDKDLQAKVTDCRTFGMGRLVPVRLRTIRGNNPDPGWEVLYKCTLSSGQAGGEMQAPGNTATVAQLPPAAICVFRARKAGLQTPWTGSIAIFGRESVPVDINVP